MLRRGEASHRPARAKGEHVALIQAAYRVQADALEIEAGRQTAG